MQAVAYSNFRKDMKTYMKKVNEDSDAIIVTSKNIEDTVVVMSKKDYDSMQETMRILSNPYLMEKIRKGDEQFENSTFETHELFEVENDE
ncbi:type II toxin-antitoxin system Phd/YefM family antitoxin [Candidatus Enterococcus ferrettii]|uniref:Antitoxin n=1 Tax=Candidatus Enterococcus ferrettii TaxID=2815324 RepID=A0ABV0EK08_9ENTE|nr:type II toxin-antitoxin system Phd/YefM family antitoxin [Enterococcus sp. 665A]MBO1338278.1 type II toxin-antitoxin system Phd/YefM family antitoxin [Enterococcus sp. 665A]